MTNIVLIAVFLSLGVSLRYIRFTPKNIAKVLNNIVIYFSYPALVLLNIPGLEFSVDLLVTAIIHWVILLASVVLVYGASKIFKWQREVLGALLLIVPLGNTSFLGFPMIQAFYGEQAVSYALIYDQLGSFLALTIYGSFIVVAFSQTQDRFSFKAVFHKIVIFPPFIALFIAVLLHGIKLPDLYFYVLKPISLTLVPLVMLAVGYQLKLKIDLQKLNPFIIGLSIKMIVAPLLVVLIVLSFGLNGMMYKVTVFEASMPPMITAGILAIQANLAPKLTASMVAYGILLSFITLPALHYILNIVLK